MQTLVPVPPPVEQPAPATRHSERTLPPTALMLQMITGFWVSRAVFAAARLGVADHLEAGARTAEELAPLTGTHAPSLYRLLRALAAVGVFAEDGQGRFALTPLGDTLRTDTPGSLRYFAMAELGLDHYQAWEHLLHSVRTGGVAFEHHFGVPVWEYYAHQPEYGAIFQRSLAGITEATQAAVLKAYDFSPCRLVVDVGGGHGSLIGAILQSHPALHGVLFDLPEVAAVAEQALAAAGVGMRCAVAGGDFFHEVPAGGDVYLLKWILHDWPDAQALEILERVRAAIRPDGRLLVVESVVPTGSEPSLAPWMDLNMMVMVGGRERTEAEYRDLLARAGFRLTRNLPTESVLQILEAVPR